MLTPRLLPLSTRVRHELPCVLANSRIRLDHFAYQYPVHRLSRGMFLPSYLPFFLYLFFGGQEMSKFSEIEGFRPIPQTAHGRVWQCFISPRWHSGKSPGGLQINTRIILWPRIASSYALGHFSVNEAYLCMLGPLTEFISPLQELFCQTKFQNSICQSHKRKSRVLPQVTRSFSPVLTIRIRKEH